MSVVKHAVSDSRASSEHGIVTELISGKLYLNPVLDVRSSPPLNATYRTTLTAVDIYELRRGLT